MPSCSRCSAPSARTTGAGKVCEACLLEETLAPAHQPAGESFGPYEILCEIGEGGLGIVYLAEQLQPIKREVALKVVKPGLASREILARFETERQAVAMMDHPHIARVFDAGTSTAGRPFFVMEFVDGLPITAYCDLRSLSISARLALFIDVCHAVEHAHRKGILHRDLKPSNVLIGESGGKVAPKVIDFGIAKALGGRLNRQSFQTEAGQLLGTVEYMSPEQADLSNRALGATSDVYSLGVLLYELLCGALPFDPERLEDAGLTAALKILREEEPPRLEARLSRLGGAADDVAVKRSSGQSTLQRELAGDLACIVHMALEKNPLRRYASAASLASDLERYLHGEPVQAHAPGFLYRARKLARRRRGVLAAGTAVLAVMVSVLAAGRFIISPRVDRPAPKVTPLTSYTGFEIHPALSPDGKRLAFAWNGDANNYDIYVKPVDGGEPVRLTTDPAHDLHPAWSPDGRSIAFLRTTPSKKEVLVAPASGGAEHKVLDISTTEGAWENDAFAMGRSPGPAWSPDGGSLAIGNRAGNGGPDSIYLVSIATGTERKLTSPDADLLGDSLPAFSPSGRSVAFVRAASQRGITDIYIVPAAGGEAKQVTFDRKTISGLAWVSEDRIAFTSNRGGGNMLWNIAAQGGTPELIAIAGRNVHNVAVSLNGLRLVVAEFFRNTNLYRTDILRHAAPEKLIATTRRNDSPKYSPDGTKIVFGSDRSGNYEIWVADADGTHARQITSFGGLPVGTPRWSPDGRQVVFDAVKDGRSAIYVVNLDGGPPRLFVDDRWDNMTPSWSVDGRFIYFASRRESDISRVWKKPVDGGPAIQITHRAGGEAVEAPDGRLVYFSDGRNGIWEVAPDGGNEGPVLGLERVRHSRSFAVTRRGAYFLREDQPPWVVEFYDFATHRRSAVANIERSILYGLPDLSVSPDDRWLLYAQLDDSGSDIMMLEDFR